MSSQPEDARAQSKHLVILSVPFQRLNRVLLSPAVLEPLLRRADVAVVTPFAEHPVFQKEFRRPGVRLWRWAAPENLKRLPGRLYGVSEILRMNGYWRRFRRQGMEWFLATSQLRLGVDGNDERHALARRLVFQALSIVGLWPKAWRIAERLAGRSVLDLPDLRTATHDYEQVTLVQSASWGMQDRMLAWMARRDGWRTVLVPYTSDQLYFCGYLMSDFDAVCVQGPAEAGFAARFHGLASARINHLGSAWFRHIDAILARSGPDSAPRTRSARDTIMFAGVASTSYHKDGQYEVIDELLRGIDDGRLAGTRLIVRPVVADEGERAAYVERYGNHARVELQWPQPTCLGLDPGTDAGAGMALELAQFIDQVRQVDLVVMAVPTSLAYDAAYLGIPSLTYFAQDSKFSKRRSLNLLIDAEKKFIDFTDLPVVQRLEQLVPRVRELLADPALSRELADRTISGWDYPQADFGRVLVHAVTGEHADPSYA
jgi:hypothetical protein